jgi:hypothetical protein
MPSIIKQLTKHLLTCGYWLQRGGTTQQKTILLGHMRCGSSLMVQILTSNADIAGYGETHLHYRSIEDLDLLTNQVYFTLKRFRPRRIVLDKILHDDHLLNDEILQAEKCTFPIMAREALSSVRSMVTTLPNWFKEHYGSSGDLVAQAADYYRRRLDSLCRYAESLSRMGRCCYFTYDDLMTSTASVFRMVEEYLRLRQPLSERYEIGPQAGRYSIGDPSEHIKRGYIDRTIVRDPIAIPELLATTLTDHFRSFDSHMRNLVTVRR